jgi:hypothetical protein
MLVVPNFEFVLLLVKGSRSQNTGRGTGGESIEVKNTWFEVKGICFGMQGGGLWV